MITKEQFLQAIKKARENSKPRKFVQSFEAIFNIRDLDLKNPSNNFTIYLSLPHLNKKKSICALVGPESVDSVKDYVDKVVVENEFDEYADMKKAKKLAQKYDVFIAQANLMPRIARIFGRVLASRKKMPNPTAGTIVPPKPNLKALEDKFRKLIVVQLKKNPVIHALIGDEKLTDEQLYANFREVYNAILEKLPNGEANIKNIYLKTTMGKPVKIE